MDPAEKEAKRHVLQQLLRVSDGAAGRFFWDMRSGEQHGEGGVSGHMKDDLYL